ncbi:BlaI/MecI/CopY family transcriptional regulator [Candidatus Uhrbacteria bacterium]|nr:BlaI/MecI/CopY family transcriptional regulator [Candidatus Uhrbacteria bacterium]
MIEQQLQSLGLSEQEANILAMLYMHAPVGASFVAKKLGCSRSSVYTVLAALTAKGLVSTTFRNDVKQFVATGPEALEQLVRTERRQLEMKERLLGDMAQHLAATQRGDLHVPQVMFFEGVEGLKRIYLSMLRDARPGAIMYVLRDEFIWDAVWSFSWEEEWQDRVRRWKEEKDVHTKLLVNPSAFERGKAPFYRTREGLACRYLPKASAVTKFALYILGDTTAILSFETGNLIGIKMVNAHLAENFVRMFEGLWSAAKE